MATDLQVTVAYTPERATITLVGDVSVGTRDRLRDAVWECRKRRAASVRIDLRDAFLDSAGLSALINLCADASLGRIELVSPPATRRLLTRLGLPARFLFERDLAIRVVTRGPRPRRSSGDGCRDRDSAGGVRLS